MDLTIVTRLAKEGRRHGLTLQWAQVHLIERLTHNEQIYERCASIDRSVPGNTTSYSLPSCCTTCSRAVGVIDQAST